MCCSCRAFSFCSKACQNITEKRVLGAKTKRGKTLGVVNVKQIIKYGEKTTEKAHCAEAACVDQIWFASLEGGKQRKANGKTK